MPTAEPETDTSVSNATAEVATETPDDTRTRWDRIDTGAVAIAAVGTVLVHPVHAMLSHSYWLDEAWVADSTRVPLSRVHAIASSTPLGFDMLLRLVPGTGLQRGRLVVLMFSVLTVIMAYVFARVLAWSSRWRARVAAVTAAVVVMLAPLSLGRNDLKQYTADAFCALAVLTAAIVVDRRPAHPVWWFTVAALVVLPFSSTSAFVTVAAFAGVLGAALLARDRRRTIEVLVNGVIAGAVIAGYYAAAVIPHTNSKLHDYWNAYYLRGTPWHMLRVGWHRLFALSHALGVPALLVIGLVIVGLVALARLRAIAIVIAIVVLWIEVAVIARARLYPFLDLRTSHFLLVSTLVIAAIGVAALIQLAYQWWRPAGAIVAIVGLVLFVAGARPSIDKLDIPTEPAREQAQFVVAHRTPNDVVLVNSSGAFGFAYYWPAGVTTRLDNNVGQGFRAEAKHLDAVYAQGRTNDTVLDALRQAVNRWRAEPKGSRLFIVRSHVSDAEAQAWKLAFAQLGLHPAHQSPNGPTPLTLGPS
jgi:MFS family permease